MLTHLHGIGSGKFGNVRAARLIANPNKRFAIKTISKESLGEEKLLLLREVDIFTNLDHPNIVKFFEVYQDEQFFHIAMEFCSGGELLEKLSREEMFSEAETKRIMFQALSAVKHLHEKGIVHRDLKLENFLFENEKPDAAIKLIDFGLAKRYDPVRKNLRTVVGTPYYVSPELLTGNYNEKCDEWSLGVMMFIMLTGEPPFNGEDDAEIFKAVSNAQYSMEGEIFQRLSAECKDLLKKLLEKNVDKRISAAQALEHPWFKKSPTTQDAEATKNNMGNYKNVMRNLSKFEKRSKFKREAMEVMVAQLKEDELKKLKDAFQFFDKNGSGEITIAELQQAIKELGLAHTNEEIQKILQNVQLGEKDKIRYTEFLTAAMDVKAYTNKEMLWTAFKFFDVDNKNSISTSNIKEVMARAGKKLTEEDVAEMTKELDILRDGRLTFEEFCKMMEQEQVDPHEEIAPEEFNHDIQWEDKIAHEKDRELNDVRLLERKSKQF